MAASPSLTPARAAVLGALHGPAELLPISSSGHITLIPWLLGWAPEELDPELRKAFEVALHAGTAAALLITLRGEVAEAVARLSPRSIWLLGLSFAPAGGDRLPLRAASSRPTSARRRRSPPAWWPDRRRWPGRIAARSGATPGRPARPTCSVARPGPGLRARARRLAQRRHAGRGAPASVHARRGQSALAPRRAAGDRRRHAAEGDPAGPARPARRAPPRRSRPARRPRSPRRWARRGSSGRSSATARCCPTRPTGSPWPRP